MRIAMLTCLALAGCSSNPADLLNQPLNEAISSYGEPVAGIDYEGARAFFFSPDGKIKQKQIHSKDLLNPDMPILETNFKPNSCIYTFNALWSGAYKEWIIHSFAESNQCGDKS